MTVRSTEPRAVGTFEATDSNPGPWMPGPDAWRGDVDPRHPRVDSDDLFSAYYVRPILEQRNRKGMLTTVARSASVRVCGPLGGHRVVDNPNLLIAEAYRLLDVAETLRALQAISPEPPEGALL